ncbi:MAG: hypothetical protein KA792_06250 [Bacteroidales bacterium]|nr:hypothetical protein [Bacteroidales bacterium]
MSWILIISLILGGMLFVILEILVVPGVVVGILGVLLMITGIYGSYSSYGSLAGNLTLAGTILFSFLAFILVLRSKTWNKVMLNSNIDSKVNVIDETEVKLGDTGKASSKLRPIGKAQLNGKYFEVNSTGDYIDAGTEIKVVKIESNKIYVEKL